MTNKILIDKAVLDKAREALLDAAGILTSPMYYKAAVALEQELLDAAIAKCMAEARQWEAGFPWEAAETEQNPPSLERWAEVRDDDVWSTKSNFMLGYDAARSRVRWVLNTQSKSQALHKITRWAWRADPWVWGADPTENVQGTKTISDEQRADYMRGYEHARVWVRETGLREGWLGQRPTAHWLTKDVMVAYLYEIALAIDAADSSELRKRADRLADGGAV